MPAHGRHEGGDMTHTKALRVSFAAVFTCGLLVALITLPFAALPIAYIGLPLGLTAAAITAALASVLLTALAGPGSAMSFIISFGVPVLWLIRLALLSRRQSLDGDYEFYPATQIIIQAVIISGTLAAFIFLANAGTPQGLPGVFAQSLQQAPQISDLIRTVYGTDTDILGVANIILITGFASWPLILLGTLQCAQALAQYSGDNLRPAETHDRLTMPVWFDFALGLAFFGAWVTSGWTATLLAVFAAIFLGAYFLLGLAVIHAISRHWNGRVWFLAGLYFLIFVMAWVVVPISLLGLLESRLNLRRLPTTQPTNPVVPPKSDDDEENR